MIVRLTVAVLCALAAVFSCAWLLAAALTNSPRFWRIAIALDQAANAAIGGDENLTISTRAARGRHKRHWCLLCKLLDQVDPGHCDRAMRDNV